MRNSLREHGVVRVARPASRTAGFTLIELLTVIAIIGILAAIVIPTVGTVRDKAQRAVDQNNLREIIKAAQIYAGDNQDRLPDPQNLVSIFPGSQAVFRWPAILAKNNVLSDPSFYFAKNDAQFSGTYPTAIINPRSAQRNQLETTFTNRRVLAWEFVGGLKMSDPATTPVAFTRGLQNNGTWHVTNGVYKDTGGFVGFLGGNVGFYPNTTGLFNSNNTGLKTNDIRQAIPYNTNSQLTSRIYATPPNGNIGSIGGTVASRGQ